MTINRQPRDLGDIINRFDGRLKKLELKGRGFSLEQIDAGVKTYPSDTRPPGTAYNVGDLWFDTNDGNAIYRWDGSDWVSVVGTGPDRARDAAASALVSMQDAASSSDGLVTTYVQSAEPTIHANGDLWIDTDDNALYRWSGSSWVAMGNVDVGELVTHPDNQISYADGRIRTYWQNNEPTATGFGDLWVNLSVPGNPLYRWNNFEWVRVLDWSLYAIADAVNKKITTFRSDTVPTSISVGDIWVNTADGNKQYRADSIGADAIGPGEWVLIQDADIAIAQETATNAQDAADAAQETADGAQEAAEEVLVYAQTKNATYRQDTEPVAGEGESFSIGDVWFNTADGNRIKIWDGTLWVDAQDLDIETARQNAADALEAAQQAASDADAAFDFAQSKNSVYRQTSEPTGGTYVAGDLWYDTDDGNKLYIYDGTNFTVATSSHLTTPNGKLVVDTTGLTGYNASNALTFRLDAATGAITLIGPVTTGGSVSGAVVTGGTVQTTETALRGIKLNSTGLSAYNGSGTPMFTLTASTGAIAMAGPIVSGGEITGALLQTTSTAQRGVKISSSSVVMYNNSGGSTFYLDGNGNAVLAGGLTSGGNISGSIITGGQFQTESTSQRGIKLDSAGMTAWNSSSVEVFKFISSTGSLEILGSLKSGSSITGTSIRGGFFTTSTTDTGPRVRVVQTGAPDGGSNWGLVEFHNGQSNWTPGYVWAAGTASTGTLRLSSPYSGTDWLNAASITMQTNTSGQRSMLLHAATLEFNANTFLLTSNNGSSIDFRTQNTGRWALILPFGTSGAQGKFWFDGRSGPQFENKITSLSESNGRVALMFSASSVAFETVASGTNYIRFSSASNNGTLPQINQTEQFPSLTFKTDALAVTTYSGASWQPIQASAFNINSDMRHKSQAEPVSGALRTLRSLTVYDYTTPNTQPTKRSELERDRNPKNAHLWGKKGYRQRGVYAQDLQKLVPHAVYEDDIEDEYSVDLYGLLSTALAAIKDLDAEVAALRKRLGSA